MLEAPVGPVAAAGPEPAGPGNGAPGPAARGKIFVGGLSWETDEDSLRAYFSSFGRVSECVIMRDRHTRHPRGFGFVTYEDSAVADRVALERHELDGRQVEAKRAVPKSECVPTALSPVSVSVTAASSPATAVLPTRATRKIFVGGLPATCGDDALRSYFSNFGDLLEAQVMYDHHTGNSRGFGFVTFAEEATVDRVVDSPSPHEVLGKFVEVKRAEPKQVIDARRAAAVASASPQTSSLTTSLSSESLSLRAQPAAASAPVQTAAVAAGYGFGAFTPAASLRLSNSIAASISTTLNPANWQQFAAAAASGQGGSEAQFYDLVGSVEENPDTPGASVYGDAWKSRRKTQRGPRPPRTFGHPYDRAVS